MPVPNWVAPVAQGAGGLFGSIISNIGQGRRQKKAFRHDQRMAQQAYGHDVDMWNRQSQWNLDMWNLQNQYNAPEAVMSRLRQAGLNPNLVATSGASGGSAASVQPAQMPRYQQVRANYDFPPIQIPDILGMYNAFTMQNAQKDNVKAATELTKEKTTTEGIEQFFRANKAAGIRLDNRMKSELANYSTDLAKLTLAKRRQELVNSIKDEQIKGHMVGRTEAEAGLKQLEYQFFKGLGIKGMRDVAPFLQLLLNSYRRR